MVLKGLRPYGRIISGISSVLDGHGRAVVIACVYTMSIFVGGIALQKLDLAGQGIALIRSLARRVSLVPSVIRAMTAPPERISIDIKHENFIKLVAKRRQALRARILLASPEDFVPAQIRHRNKVMDVKLRLKGDLPDHWEGEQWSFKIVVKGDNTFFGMKEFSIQHPKTRRYIHEWLYHRVLKREGLVALRYDFINVTLNGKALGVYAVEEHFDKRLVEHNQAREGPIVRFNEQLLFRELATHRVEALPEINTLGGTGSYFASEVDAFQTRKSLSNPALYPQFIKAVHLLEAFRRGHLITSQVFDIHKLAVFLAITDLMGTEHGAHWNNARFYYNPITSRLEPIGFDGNAPPPSSTTTPLVGILPHLASATPALADYYLALYATLFNDMQFYREYIRQLERISDTAYLDDLFDDVKNEMEQQLTILSSEFPDFNFTKNTFYERQRYIKKLLHPTKAIHAYQHRFGPAGVELELGNIQYLPIEVLGVSPKGSVLLPPDRETILPARNQAQVVEYRIVRFAFPSDFAWSDAMIPELRVHYKLFGTADVRYERISPWSYLDSAFTKRDFIRGQPNPRTFDFLVVNDAEKAILIKPGSWDITENVIIPQGYRLVALPGTQLNLRDSAKILSYSALEFIGSAEEPILIQSSDSTGQGIVVLQATLPSVLAYVTFSNLSNPSQSGWALTGAVTFYESPVNISHSKFVGVRSEDALNIVRSTFSITSTLFMDTSFDALDVDFGKGAIADSSFVAIGNDAIDLSGSTADLRNIFIDGAGDKGLSIGENSHARAEGVHVTNAMVGVASKDLGEIILRRLYLSGCTIGLAAYQKKAEFGPGSLEVQDVQMQDVSVPYVVERGSFARVEGRTIAQEQGELKNHLESVKNGKINKSDRL